MSNKKETRGDRPKKEQEGKEWSLRSRSSASSSTPLYPSMLKRKKETQRIEKENEAMRKRIEATKPTPGLKRAKQLADYNQQAKHLGAPPPGPSNLTACPSTGYPETGGQEEMSKEEEEMRGKEKFPVSSNESSRKKVCEKTKDRPKKEQERKERRLRSIPPASSSTPVYPNMLKRKQEKERIQKENQAMRKRIDATKPTPGLKRAEQLADHKQQAKFLGAPPPGPSNFTACPSTGYPETGGQEEMSKEEEEMRGKEKFPVSSNESSRKKVCEKTKDRPKKEQERKERRLRSIPPASSSTPVYPNMLKRKQEMEGIQKENQAMRKRIDATKPTPGLKRAEQLADHKQQAKFLGAPPPGPSNFTACPSTGYPETGGQEEMSKEEEEMRGKEKFPVSSNESSRKKVCEKTKDRPKKEQERKERRLRSIPPASSSTPVYPNMLKRKQEKERIQKENQAMRKRIEATKPTPGMKRAKQLADYNQQAKHLGAPPPGPSNFSACPSTAYYKLMVKSQL